MASTLAIPGSRPGPLTVEEALAQIQARAEEKSNSFKVKVHRKMGIGSQLVHIASLEEATVAHLADSEQWLPVLAGGGPIFVLAVAHAGDTLPFVTFSPPNLNGAPREVDPLVVKRDDWKGPPVLTYPGPKPVQTATAARTDLEATLNKLLGPPAETAAGSGTRGSEPPAAGGGSGLSELRLEMAVGRLFAESQKNTDRQIAALADVVKSVAAAVTAPRAEPKPLVAQIVELTPFISALAGMLVPVLTASRETAARAEERREAEAARQREREEKRAEEMMKLVAAGNERAATGAADTVKLMGPMVESVAAMSRVTLQNVATMRELSAGEPADDGLVGVLKAGIGAFAEVWAAKASAAGMPAPAPRQLPPKPASAAPPAASAPDAPAPGEANEDAAREAYLRTAPSEEIITRVIGAIREEANPTELAEDFVEAFALNAGLAAAVQAAGGALPLFRTRLDDDGWLQAHMPYVQGLVAALTAAMNAPK